MEDALALELANQRLKDGRSLFAGRRQSETEVMHTSHRAALSLSKEQGQGSQFGVDAEPQLT